MKFTDSPRHDTGTDCSTDSALLQVSLIKTILSKQSKLRQFSAQMMFSNSILALKPTTGLKRSALLASVLLAVLDSSVVLANSNTAANKYYVGIGAISSSLNPRVQPDSYSLNDSRAKGWKFSLGRRISDHWSAEFSHADAGAAEIHASSLSNTQSNPIATVHYKATALNLLWHWRPHGTVLNGFARVGAAKLDTRARSRALSYSLDQLHSATFLYGLGLEWSPLPHSQLRLAYDSYDKDLSWVSFSLLMGFGAQPQRARNYQVAGSQTVYPPVNKKELNSVHAPLDTRPATADKRCLPFSTNVFFQPGSHELLADDKVSLYLISQNLDSNVSWSVSLTGHADYRGSSAKNELLTTLRIASTVEYIQAIKHTSKAWHFTQRSRGEREQFDPHHTPVGRANNRRVHLEFRCN